MKLGIVGAMPQEIDAIRECLHDPVIHHIGNREYYEGTLFGKEVVVVFSRWGKVAAASTATLLIERFNTDVIVFTGVAGAAATDLEIGDIIIADNLIQHDIDASTTDMFRRFEVPLLGVSHFPANVRLSLLARDAVETYISSAIFQEEILPFLGAFRNGNPAIRLGTIGSGDQFISSAAKLAELREAIPGLQCVEMEGAAVAQVCFEYEIPCVVFRAISDKANHAAPVDFIKFITSIASHYSLGFVKHFLELL